jgi:hypothetical protein
VAALGRQASTQPTADGRPADGTLAADDLPTPRGFRIVLADWCPHCVPLSDRYLSRLARRLGVGIRRLDIDRPSDERRGDALVRRCGDAAPDYLIPQVFLDWSDGTTEHLFTGFSEAVARTRRAWRDLLDSERWSPRRPAPPPRPTNAPARLPRSVVAAMRSDEARCYRHCPEHARPRAINFAGSRSAGWVYACPSGVVSLVAAIEGPPFPPLRKWRDAFAARARPRTLVRLRDLRPATRHGPELGRACERKMAGSDASARAVYWRVYPFRRSGREHRVFACFRHGPGEARFFASPLGGADPPLCPDCGGRVGRTRGVRRTGGSVRRKNRPTS